MGEGPGWGGAWGGGGAWKGPDAAELDVSTQSQMSVDVRSKSGVRIPIPSLRFRNCRLSSAILWATPAETRFHHRPLIAVHALSRDISSERS